MKPLLAKPYTMKHTAKHTASRPITRKYMTPGCYLQSRLRRLSEYWRRPIGSVFDRAMGGALTLGRWQTAT